MGFFKNLFRRKFEKVSATREPKLDPISAPLGLCPGSVWSPPDLEISLASADGGLIQPFSGDQIVESVGKTNLFGLDVYNIYFRGSAAFVQVVTSAGRMDDVKQLRIFTRYAEVVPSTVQDIELWLGKLDRDASGKVIRDFAGNSRLVEPGLIGGDAFQIDGPPPRIYNRQWNTTDDRAVKFNEFKQAPEGSTVVSHESMEYARRLADDPNGIAEYLFATFIGAQGRVMIYIGIDLDPSNQRIISVA